MPLVSTSPRQVARAVKFEQMVGEHMRRCRSLRWALVVGASIIMSAQAQIAAAGETIKFHSKHINVATKFETTAVPDQPGHVIAIFQAKGLGVRTAGPAEQPYKIDLWGTGDYQKDGTGKEGGYGRFTFADGSSYYEEWKGNVANGHDIGTAVYKAGTGRFKDAKGESKFDCLLFGDRFICEVDGTIELP
jgi:hypothetical protein